MHEVFEPKVPNVLQISVFIVLGFAWLYYGSNTKPTPVNCSKVTEQFKQVSFPDFEVEEKKESGNRGRISLIGRSAKGEKISWEESYPWIKDSKSIQIGDSIQKDSGTNFIVITYWGLNQKYKLYYTCPDTIVKKRDN